MYNSVLMEQFVHDLQEHGLAGKTPDGDFRLDLVLFGLIPLVIVETVQSTLASVTCHLADGDDRTVPEQSILLYINREGRWIPLEITRILGGRQVYAEVDAVKSTVTIHDEQGQLALTAYADLLAHNLRKQAWLGCAQETQPPPQSRPEPPNWETIEEWMVEDGGCEATDGCWVEEDGRCPHGCNSWLRELGLV